ncbi:hypothetical protein LEP1GSC005_2604 [Leptospira santarosai str. ST188]|uniref:Uncharacterized protein n=1 Tax=Leptospira santarosai str. ZUN179 TaxID=1049985 RepID=M6V6M1_9LEPT|nr:hypothetical protein LEP1GSC005_2604 [Leptospira santarosai str. ST188]EMO45138.1 hypothetical protein LEP1GSC187_1776 [Leptospira santarosai str. ZUN179]
MSLFDSGIVQQEYFFKPTFTQFDSHIPVPKLIFLKSRFHGSPFEKVRTPLLKDHRTV